MFNLFKNGEIKFEMSGADQTRLLTGERQDLMENSVEQVRAGVGLYDKDNYNKIQCKPLNAITLGQIQTDKFN
jgi:hypothetical protein